MTLCERCQRRNKTESILADSNVGKLLGDIHVALCIKCVRDWTTYCRSLPAFQEIENLDIVFQAAQCFCSAAPSYENMLHNRQRKLELEKEIRELAFKWLLES